MLYVAGWLFLEQVVAIATSPAAVPGAEPDAESRGRDRGRTVPASDPTGCGGGCTTMNADDVLEVVGALENAGVRFWLDGGWGVDALLGEQTREHTDLDLVSDLAEATALRDALFAIGYRVRQGGTAANFVLADDQGHEVDVHPIAFDARGFGEFDLGDGRRWPFPPAAFRGVGRVAGRAVACLSPDAQVQCHGQGYRPTEDDLRDMERLQERFGVVLPVHLCRQPGTSRHAALGPHGEREP